MKDKLNSGHYLELMDRLHIVMCNIDDHCIQHPVAKLDKKISTLLNKALEEIWEAYQEVGRLDYEKNDL
jgi:hypothetical protein